MPSLETLDMALRIAVFGAGTVMCAAAAVTGKAGEQ